MAVEGPSASMPVLAGAERPAGARRRKRRSLSGRAASRRLPRLDQLPMSIGDPAPVIVPALSDGEPYRPDTVIDGGLCSGLTVRAASVRGLLKRYEGGPRQDDLCLRVHRPTDTLIVAVADGVSGAPRSHLGAALAVRHATATVAAQLGGDGLDWARVFRHAAWALVEEHRRATGEEEAGVESAAADLATTLVVAAVSNGHIRAAALGDSPALLLREGSFATLAGERADGGELLGGGVAALPRAGAAPSTAETELTPGDVLLLCTDGLSLPLADGRGEVGRVFARELACAPDLGAFARLLDFSRATYDDDRTLVAIWPAEP